MRPALCCVRLVDPAVPCSARPLTDSVAQEEDRKVLSQLHSSALSAPISPARRAALADTLRQLRDYMAERTLYFGLAALLNVNLIFPGLPQHQHDFLLEKYCGGTSAF